jgi:hypothetical protein
LGTGYDILILPDKIRYRNVQEGDIPTLVEEQLVNRCVAAAIPHQPLTQQYVVVCTHGQRDVRCGECGPPLVEALEKAIAAQQLTGEMVVCGSSHVGGHMFAGNVLVYPTGDWYGYVTPADVPRLIEDIAQGRIAKDLWRGRMGLTQQEQEDSFSS